MTEQRLFELLDVLAKYNTESLPGRNTDLLQNGIEQLLKTLNLDIQREHLYENSSVIVTILKGEDKDTPKLIPNDHVDVVDADDGSGWQYPPFQLTEKKGWLYGRDVSDMGGGMASLPYILEKLHQEGRRPKGNIAVQSVIGEEVGETGTRRAYETGLQADLALVLDASESIALRQGGIVTGWTAVKSRNTIYDGTRSQTIHAGGGLFDTNAVEEMTKIIQVLNELEQCWVVIKYSPGMSPGVNTINSVVTEGGCHPAPTADECRLWITVHYLSNKSYEDVTKEIEACLNRIADADIQLRGNPLQSEWGGESMIEDKGGIFPSFIIPLEHPGFKQLQDAHYHVHHSEMKYGMSTTAADGDWATHFDIPTTLYGPGNLEEAHSVDERIESQELQAYGGVLYTFSKHWHNHPEKQTKKPSHAVEWRDLAIL